MTNIIDFPKKKFDVNFVLPDDKVIHVRKPKSDLIELSITGTQGIASLRAYNLKQAQDMVCEIFPYSSIHFS